MLKINYHESNFRLFTTNQFDNIVEITTCLKTTTSIFWKIQSS